MIDILCKALNRMLFEPNILSMSGDLSQRRGLISLMMAVDPLRFSGWDTLAEIVLQITEEIKQQPGTVLFPGGRRVFL